MSPAPRKPRIKVGVIGLGIIGGRVAANLRGAGHQVYVWSRSPHRAPNFLGSVVEVADLSDVIQVFVSDDAALLEVTRTIAAALSPRHVFASHATVAPETARQAASIIEGQGARYLDAPFTGSKMAAQNRQLVYYVGGGREALDEIRPVLEASSKAVLHVGGIGDASVLKIATNMVTASTVQTLAEALALVRAAGMSGQKLVEALENNGSRSGTSDLKLPAMIAGNFDPNFSLKHMVKDARLALNLADGLNLSLPVTETTSEVLSLGMANGWADQDFCCVAQLYPAPETPEVLPGADQGVPKPESAETIGENTGKIPRTAGAPEKSALAMEASGIADMLGTALPVTPTVAGRSGAAAPRRAGFKENTLRTLRGLFKAPASKAKAAPVPPAEQPGSLDTILPTEGLPSNPPSSEEGAPPELVRPDELGSVTPGQTSPEPPDAPRGSTEIPAEPVTNPMLAPER